MGDKSRIERFYEEVRKFVEMFIHIAQAISYLIAFNAIIQATIAVVGPCNLGDIFTVSVLAGIWLIPLFIHEYYKVCSFYSSNTVKNKGARILVFLLELAFAISLYVLFPILGGLLAAASVRANKEIASINYLSIMLALTLLFALFIGIIEPLLGRSFEDAFSKGIEGLRKSNKMIANIRIIYLAGVSILVASYIIIVIFLISQSISFYSKLIEYCTILRNG